MDESIRYQDVNAETISRWIADGWTWGTPIDHATYLKALAEEWDVVLTPTKPVPRAWFGDLKDRFVLGLASGGGQQMPIFAAAGANCTVFDYTAAQLESEQLVAEREGYDITLIRGDMTERLPFPDDHFDIIFHPVSNVYIEFVEPVFQECYRILKPGGILLCGLCNGFNFVVDISEREIVNRLPFNPLRNPDHREIARQNDDGYQFSHTVSEQIGGQLKAGFILTHLEEDTNGYGRLHDMNIPTFMLTRAVKPK